jgi:transcriptional regulator with XRE-family HTH domain
MTRNEAFGRVVALHRVQAGWGRQELATRAEISYPYLCEIENGKKEPSLRVMRRLASELGCLSYDLWRQADVLEAGGKLL